MRALHFFLNSRVRASALSIAHIVVKRDGEAGGILHRVQTMHEFQEFIQDEEDAARSAARCIAYTTTIPGSAGYWTEAGRRFSAMVMRFGPPAFFLTLSVAEMHLPDIAQLLPCGANASASARKAHSIKYPALVSDWFKARVDEALKAMQASSMQITHYAVRYA